MATYYGTNGNDSIVGSASPDNIYGYADGAFPEDEAGNDFLRGGAGNDRIFGGGGNDTLVGDEGGDTLYGGSGNDVLFGGSGNDVFEGGDGDDILIIHDYKRDYYNGGTGTDTLRLNASISCQYIDLPATASVERLDLAGFVLSGTSYGDIYDLSGVKSFKYTGQFIDLGGGDDRFKGHIGSDRVRGGDGNDELQSGGGNDVLSGGRGSDIYDGGAGDDVFLVSDDSSDTYIGGSGTDTVQLEGATTRYRFILNKESSVERLIGGEFSLNGTANRDIFDLSAVTYLKLKYAINLGSGNDSFVGSKLNDFVVGGSGNDTLHGASGDDTIAGSTGQDVLFGDGGNDIILIGDSNDDVYRGGGGADTIKLTEKTFRSQLVLNTTASVEHLDLGNHQLKGTTGNDIFDFSGLQSIIGKDKKVDLGSGNDRFTGYAGADFMFGNSGTDTLSGGGGSDFLDGGSGNDLIKGGAGDDRLIGGKGTDVLNGGAGKDIFILRNVSDSSSSHADADIIEDFSAEDLIDLSSVDANTLRTGNSAFTFIGADKFTKSPSELRFERSHGDVFISGDVNGDGRSDFSVLVEDISNIVKSDFIL